MFWVFYYYSTQEHCRLRYIARTNECKCLKSQEERTSFHQQLKGFVFKSGCCLFRVLFCFVFSFPCGEAYLRIFEDVTLEHIWGFQHLTTVHLTVRSYTIPQDSPIHTTNHFVPHSLVPGPTDTIHCLCVFPVMHSCTVLFLGSNNIQFPTSAVGCKVHKIKSFERISSSWCHGKPTICSSSIS